MRPISLENITILDEWVATHTTSHESMIGRVEQPTIAGDIPVNVWHEFYWDPIAPLLMYDMDFRWDPIAPFMGLGPSYNFYNEI